MQIKDKVILILAPHTDDGEFGCGATINKLIEDGNKVYYVAFSTCRHSVLKEFPEDVLATEVKEATAILGIPKENLKLYEYDVRTFNFHRQAILDDLIKLREEINPDVVFMPSGNDIHQDHQTIHTEGIRTFKNSCILCYELPWNQFTFNSQMFVLLEEKHLKKKVDALLKYKSQQHRIYAKEKFIRAIAHTRGVQIGSNYAEDTDDRSRCSGRTWNFKMSSAG
jgi:LmbE family N-acetylglucosaminyl deacetylase